MKNKSEGPGGYQGGHDSGSVADKAREVASTAADKAREAASDLGAKARDAATAVSGKASEMASSVGQSAESATSSVGSGMQSLASSIRQHSPDSGMLKSAAGSVADSLESGGRYLQEQGLSGMGDDLTNLIRRNPLPALLAGVAVGFLLARATRS
jgi:hypothetical protein